MVTGPHSCNLRSFFMILLFIPNEVKIIFLQLDIFMSNDVYDPFDVYRRRRYFRTHLYAILGQFWTIFPYFRTPMWKKQ